MSITEKEASYFSRICTETCGGICCDPWWGIISYGVTKRGGLSAMNSFRSELIRGIREREKRITDAYVTSEEPPRPLFGSPERYNVVVSDIRADGTTLNIRLIAMYAFRCAFLSDDKACTIHPSVLGGGDIRPPHCGFLGSPEAGPDELGYCRIIHAADEGEGGGGTLTEAVAAERGISEKNFGEGVPTIEEAAERVVTKVRAYAQAALPNTAPAKSDKGPGRNDPCPCGSGKKFKKCHGR